MTGVFWRQFRALFWKNWIVVSKHPFVCVLYWIICQLLTVFQLNILRCFIFPVAYGIFLAVAQLFLSKPNNVSLCSCKSLSNAHQYGIGQPIPVFTLSSQFDGSAALIWADGTDGTSSPTPDQIMARITTGFDQSQLNAIRKVDSPADIPAQCPQNFNLFSECFAAVAFNNIPGNGNASNPVNYTIRADGGLFHIDVVRHTSDFEKKILPLQWAIDEAIIELQTGVKLPTPLEWPFTQETNQQQSTDIRLSKCLCLINAFTHIPRLHSRFADTSRFSIVRFGLSLNSQFQPFLDSSAMSVSPINFQEPSPQIERPLSQHI